MSIHRHPDDDHELPFGHPGPNFDDSPPTRPGDLEDDRYDPPPYNPPEDDEDENERPKLRLWPDVREAAESLGIKTVNIQLWANGELIYESPSLDPETVEIEVQAPLP